MEDSIQVPEVVIKGHKEKLSQLKAEIEKAQDVVPDVKVPAAQALEVAERLATTELAKKRLNQETANK